MVERDGTTAPAPPPGVITIIEGLPRQKSCYYDEADDPQAKAMYLNTTCSPEELRTLQPAYCLSSLGHTVYPTIPQLPCSSPHTCPPGFGCFDGAQGDHMCYAQAFLDHMTASPSGITAP